VQFFASARGNDEAPKGRPEGLHVLLCSLLSGAACRAAETRPSLRPMVKYLSSTEHRPLTVCGRTQSVGDERAPVPVSSSSGPSNSPPPAKQLPLPLPSVSPFVCTSGRPSIKFVCLPARRINCRSPAAHFVWLPAGHWPAVGQRNTSSPKGRPRVAHESWATRTARWGCLNRRRDCRRPAPLVTSIGGPHRRLRAGGLSAAALKHCSLGRQTSSANCRPFRLRFRRRRLVSSGSRHVRRQLFHRRGCKAASEFSSVQTAA